MIATLAGDVVIALVFVALMTALVWIAERSRD